MRLRDKIGQFVFVVRYGWRLWRGRRAVISHLSLGVPGPVPMPAFVQLQVTNLCDQRCRMCGQWGATGVFRPSPEALATDGEAEHERIRELIGVGRQLSLGEYSKLLDQLVPFDPIVGLFGGEPLLYPEVMALARAVKTRNLTLTLITNGSRLEQYADELVSIGIDSVAVSIDGPPEQHDSIRGREGSFARAAAGIEAVAVARNRSKRSLPILLAILPITELNMADLPAGVAALARLPLDAINIGLRWFVPREAGIAYEDTMRKTFGVSAPSWKGFEFSWPGGPEAIGTTAMTGLARFLQTLRRRRCWDAVIHRHPWISFVPDLTPDQVPVYLADHTPTFGHDFCPAPWYFAQVLPDGNVVMCGDFPDYSLGNLRRTSFEDVWRGERARAFRETIREQGLPICNRCCSRYVYGRWRLPQFKTAAASRGTTPRAITASSPGTR